MLAITCDNSQKMKVTCTPDGKLDGPLRITVVNGDGSFSQDLADPLSFEAISGTAVFDATTSDSIGVTSYRVEGDVRMGPETVLIGDDVVLTVTPVPIPEATKLGLAAGAPEPK